MATTQEKRLSLCCLGRGSGYDQTTLDVEAS